MATCAATKRLNGAEVPSDGAIQSGYIFIVRLNRRGTITQLAAWLSGAPIARSVKLQIASVVDATGSGERSGLPGATSRKKRC